MTHWLEQDWPEPARFCLRCKQSMPGDWDYGWCKECQDKTCRHGQLPHECNECMIESDHAFDANREQQFFKDR